MADLSLNCKGFLSRESVHARVTESRAQGTGVGRAFRQSPSRVRSVFLLIYELTSIRDANLKMAATTDSHLNFLSSISELSIDIEYNKRLDR